MFLVYERLMPSSGPMERERGGGGGWAQWACAPLPPFKYLYSLQVYYEIFHSETQLLLSILGGASDPNGGAYSAHPHPLAAVGGSPYTPCALPSPKPRIWYCYMLVSHHIHYTLMWPCPSLCARIQSGRRCG